MIEQRKFSWSAAAAFFFAGCAVTFLVLRYGQGAGSLVVPVGQPAKSKWEIQADFTPPPSIVVNDPDKKEILSFEVATESKNTFPPSYPVTIHNLSDRSYSVTYDLLAYDAQHRRVDDTSDSVTIGAKETVLNKLEFSHQVSVDHPDTFKSFRLIVDIQH